jgi:legumain
MISMFLYYIPGIIGAIDPDGSLRALIVAGSNGFSNYRHQADVCHQYNLMTSAIAASEVTLMMYDDVAWSRRNPLIGRLFNWPGGSNVYNGCFTDYREDKVSLNNFLYEINRLTETNRSTVFISFVDHGQPGYLLLPNGDQLDSETLLKSLRDLSETSPNAVTLVYVEACHAGSLFEGRELPDRTLVVTAANATESSWAAFCPTPDHPLADFVNGVHIGACLGDLFSVAWITDIESRISEKQNVPLRTHIEAVKNIVSQKSNVMVYGDLSLLDMYLFDLFPPSSNLIEEKRPQPVNETIMIESSQPQKGSDFIKYIPESVNTEVIM